MAKFFASWSSKYYTTGKTATRSLVWFSEKNGYDKTDIATIKKLKVGDSVEIDKGHTIVRIK